MKLRKPPSNLKRLAKARLHALTEDALQAKIEDAVSREVSRRLARLAVPQKRGGGCG